MFIHHAANRGIHYPPSLLTGYLHQQGEQVVAWTLDPAQPAHVALARRLAAVAVDRSTTNDAPAMARVLAVPAEF